MKRLKSLALLSSALVFAARAEAQDRIALRAAGPPNDGFKAMYYGEQSGIFAKDGLTVDIRPMINGPAAAAALISGDVDVAMVGIQVLILAHQRGIPMRMLSPNHIETSDKPTNLTLVLKGSPIRDGRDLNGRTLATQSLQDINTIATFVWINREGGDSKTIHTVEIPSSAAAEALERGRADAATLVEPFASQALASGKLRVLVNPMAAIGKAVQLGGYVVMEPVVEKKFDAMSRLAHGLHEAALYTNTHLTETIDLVASYSGASRETIAKMNRVIDPEYCEARNIQPLIDALARFGTVDKAFPAAEIISSAALKAPRR